MTKFRITRRELDQQPNLVQVLRSVHTQTTPSLEGQVPFRRKEKNISSKLKRDQATQTKNYDSFLSDDTDDTYQYLNSPDSSHNYKSGLNNYEFLDEARERTQGNKTRHLETLNQETDTEPLIIRGPFPNKKLSKSFKSDTNEIQEYQRYVLPSIRIDETDFDTKKESYLRNLEMLDKEDQRLEQEIKKIKLFRITKLRIVDYLQAERIKILDDIRRLKNLVPVC